MFEEDETPQPRKRFTTVHDRYEVGDSCCGLVSTETSLKKASALAVTHAEKHSKEEGNTVTVVSVFDRMARRDCQDTWQFPVTGVSQ